MRPDAYFAYPGDLEALTGGYAYDRRVLQELRNAGMAIDAVALGTAVPGAAAADLEAAAEVLIRHAGAGAPVIVDGLALGVLPAAAARVAARAPLVALVHHPLAMETGLEPATAAGLHASERDALKAASAVIATSFATCRTLIDDYCVPADIVRVARPGFDEKRFAAPRSDLPVRLLSIGSLIPRKGHPVLIDALAQIADLDWTATIVGGGDNQHARDLRARVGTVGLDRRIRLAGAVPPQRLESYYRGCDLFVLPSLYEGYGMVVGEALAFGLPVIGTDGGALIDTIPEGAGRRARAGDTADLARHLRAVIGRPGAVEEMAAAARACAAALPRWNETAAVFRDVIDRLA